MDQAGHPTALVFDLQAGSPFFFKCQVCGVCCSNKAIRISPYEALRLARSLKISTSEFLRAHTEEGGTVLRNKPDGTCVFLNPRGCGVHPDRPLVCRLFPLGQITDKRGKLRYASMPLHPDCLGLFDTDGTVESYLESQGTGPYFHYDRVYAGLDKMLREKLSAPRGPAGMPSPSFLSLWLDVEASVASYCGLGNGTAPQDLDELVTLHIRALNEWTAGL
jgi:Fe-S-cluster containining protein